MSNDDVAEGEEPVQSTEPSTRPRDYVADVDAPLDLREDAHELYKAVTDSESVRPENVRLAFRIPPESDALGSWSKRPSWCKYRCALTHTQFAVPRDAPVPVIAADKRKSSEEGSWTITRIIHPDLLYDRPQLLRELTQSLDNEIFDLLYDLCEAYNFLKALSRMDELPDGGIADPYPRAKCERRGYAAVGDRRPAHSG